MKKELDFKIKTYTPKNNAMFDKTDSKLSEAIYTIFPLETEEAKLHWGTEEISLSYRYDISIMIDDIIQMIIALQSENNGELSIDWPSNTFAANWNMVWVGDSIKITSHWREGFNATEYLKKNNIIEINRYIFLKEWKNILKILIQNLEYSGYNKQNLIDMVDLLKVYSLLEKCSDQSELKVLKLGKRQANRTY